MKTKIYMGRVTHQGWAGMSSLWCGLPLCAVFVLLVGCSMIDEDQGDCGEEARMDYELELITNISTEVKTELNTQGDISLASLLKGYLGGIFSDFAHDVNLLFYGVDDASPLLYHDSHIMNGSESSYTLLIPRQRYMHLAVANVEDDPVVRLEGTENCHTAVLRQVEGDIIDSHNTGEGFKAIVFAITSDLITSYGFMLALTIKCMAQRLV